MLRFRLFGVSRQFRCLDLFLCAVKKSLAVESPLLPKWCVGEGHPTSDQTTVSAISLPGDARLTVINKSSALSPKVKVLTVSMGVVVVKFR